MVFAVFFVGIRGTLFLLGLSKSSSRYLDKTEAFGFLICFRQYSVTKVSFNYSSIR